MDEEVSRLSISADVDRRAIVQSIKQEIGSNEYQKRRRRSSSQNVKPKLKKKRLRPPKITTDVSSVKKQVTISDIRDLVLHVFNENDRKPNWLSLHNCANIEKVVVLFAPGLNPKDFGASVDCKDLKDHVQPFELQEEASKPEYRSISSFFSLGWPTKSPGNKEKVYSAYSKFTSVPLTKAERKTSQLSAITFDKIFMTVDEMIVNRYPIHSFYNDKLSAEQQENIAQNQDPDSWVETKSFQHDGSRTFAIDCEMCLSGEKQVLTRVSMLNFDNEVIIDKLVKPDCEITDYVTQYSGITEDMLKDVTTTLKDIQQEILQILSADDTLIGHSLESDLKVLKIRHKTIVDTALIYDHQFAANLKPSLRWLAKKYLETDIQSGKEGHDSIEDAKTCLDLVKLKLAYGLEFGRNVTCTDIFTKINKKLVKELKKKNGDRAITKDDIRQSLVVDFGKSAELRGLNMVVGEKVKTTSDDETMNTVIEKVDNDLIIASFRETEIALGWRKVYGAENEEKIDYEQTVSNTGRRIEKVLKSLPENTLVILYCECGDKIELGELQTQKRDSQNDAPDSGWTVDDQDRLLRCADSARDSFFMVGLKTIESGMNNNNESAISEN